MAEELLLLETGSEGHDHLQTNTNHAYLVVTLGALGGYLGAKLGHWLRSRWNGTGGRGNM